VAAIIKELIFNEHESITDVAALEDAKLSLTRMISVSEAVPALETERRGGSEHHHKHLSGFRQKRDAAIAIRDFAYFFGGSILRSPMLIAVFAAQDFLRDSYPEMPESKRHEIAASMDMSRLSAKYEQSLPQAIKHVVTGDIVRM
jgi:hypothetical protein